MMARALPFALLLQAVAAHSDSLASPRGLRNDDRERRGREPREHIWGKCDQSQDESHKRFWVRRSKGCTMEDDFKCDSHLSAGPEDADVEVVLRGFPNSTDEEPIHVAWWAARRSPTEYDPLDSPRGASAYGSFRGTYPKYYDDDFNGGNVRVSETGEATIRVRRPSTYNVHDRRPPPHIHLRVCKRDNFMYRPLHKVSFDEDGTYVRGSRKPFRLEVISSHEFANRTQPVGDNGTTTTQQPPMIIVDDPQDPDGTQDPNDPDDSSPRQVLINTARDSPDLDALEFSPVYNCLVDDTFFNHFTAECAEECPDDSAVEHGQCVRQETDGEPADFEATWRLEIECARPCWHGRKYAVMHDVRLSVAGDFDIPFQEVSVKMAFKATEERRLLDAEVREALLTVKVVSKRLSQEDAGDLTSFTRDDLDFLSQLLGLDVLSVEQVNTPDGQFLDEPVQMDPDTDPYEPAYVELEPLPPPKPSTALSFLPMPAIIGIAAGVVVILSVIVGMMFWRRRRAQRNANAQRAEAKAADLNDQQPSKESPAEDNNKKPVVEAEEDPEEEETHARL